MRGLHLTIRALTANAGRQSLGPVDLDLPPATYACLLGPPAAGKTLWLRAVSGLSPSAGALLADGSPLAATPPRRRGVALLSRPTAQPGPGTVASRLSFAQYARAIPPARRAQARRALLAEFDLDGAQPLALLDPPARLRARLAAALAGEPRLLLLDDPLADCADPAPAIELLRAATRQRALTVLHATQRRHEAFALSDRLVLLDSGRILQSGPPSQLYDRPETLAIARRLGPVNLLPGRLVEVENDVALVQLDCGPLIEADPPAADLPAQAACQVLLRPERISVSPLPPAELGSSAIAAMVREATHMGDTLRLVLSIGADANLIVMRPAALAATGLHPGRTVSIAWQSRHALTFGGEITDNR